MNDNTIIFEVSNIYTKVVGASGQVTSAIYNELSCLVPNYWFSSAFKNGRWDGRQRFFNKLTKKFPTGLLFRVTEIIEPYETEYKIVDNRTSKQFQLPAVDFDEIQLSDQKALRDYQVEAVNTIVNNEVEGLSFQRGIVNIATNGGKTVVAEAVIRHIYPHLDGGNILMFVTHSKEIAYQAKKSFENDLGIEVGFIGDNKWQVEKVTIALVSTLYSRMKRKHESFTSIQHKVIGFIGDEIHHSSSTSWYEVLFQFEEAIIRLGLTGTVDETDEEKRMRLLAVTGGILIKISNDYLIKNGYSAKPECKLVPIDYPDIDSNMRYYGQQGEAGELSYQDVYQKGIVKNDYRNYLIAKICQKEVSDGGQLLILVEHIEHGVAVENMIDIVNPDIRHIFLHGELKSDERQTGLELLKAGDVDVVVSTAILDEGVDVPNINAVVYARGGKSIRKLLQGIGRGLRKKDDGSSLKFYDFIDNTSGYLLKHSLNRYKTLKKEKFEIKKLDLATDLGYTEQENLYFMENYDTAFDNEVFVYVSDF